MEIDTQALFHRHYDRLASSMIPESTHYFDVIDGLGKRLGFTTMDYEFRTYLSQARFEKTLGISTHPISEAYQRGGAVSVWNWVRTFGLH